MLANPCLDFFVSTQNQPNESRLLGQIIQYKINLMKVVYWAKSSNSKSKAGIGLTISHFLQPLLVEIVSLIGATFTNQQFNGVTSVLAPTIFHKKKNIPLI